MPDKAGAAPTSTETKPHVQFLPLEDKDKESRFRRRQAWRAPLYQVPVGELFELPGRPQVCFSLRHYGDSSFGTPASGAKCAREDFDFLFKAFESGQTPPHRLKKQDNSTTPAPTIHQYLDWTVTATEATDADDVDFGGFRTILLHQRHIPEYPPDDDDGKAVPLRNAPLPFLGGPLPPRPPLVSKGTKPVSVANIRIGQGYMEVPFFATNEHHRGKGYGRCLLEAIEMVARKLDVPRMLLCSTDEDKVRTMWSACGFEYTTDQQIRQWDVREGDLIYMTNTVQMHKHVPPALNLRPVLIKHGAFQCRIYMLVGGDSGAKPSQQQPHPQQRTSAVSRKKRKAVADSQDRHTNSEQDDDLMDQASDQSDMDTD